MAHSDVNNRLATPLASIRACRVTLNGSTIPDAYMSTNSSLEASYPLRSAKKRQVSKLVKTESW